MENTYDQVKNQAEGLIKAYRDDLLCHDKRAIAENPGVPFLHFTGETGTCIEFLRPADAYPPKDKWIPHLFGSADRWHLLNEVQTMVRGMPKWNRDRLVLYYDGNGRVRKIDQARAETIARNYYENIRRQFK